MRITGGEFGRRRLKVPKGLDVRPTPDLVKQAIFNSLGAYVVGARVLELFAGSGALGIECLSRGAREVVAVEKAAKTGRMISQNAQTMSLLAGKFSLRVQDAFLAVSQMCEAQEKFDLIIADPPYGEKNVGRESKSFAQQLLKNAQLPMLLAEGGLFILGHTKRDQLSVASPWRETKMLKHGDTVIRFFRVDHSESQP